jgi:hypothetical protein
LGVVDLPLSESATEINKIPKIKNFFLGTYHKNINKKEWQSVNGRKEKD